MRYLALRSLEGHIFGSNQALSHSGAMEEIHVINPETSGQFEVLFQVVGTVKSHSLVVSSFIPNETKKLVEFKVNLVKTTLVLNGELLKGRGVMRSIHDSIRKLFQERIYTDHRDVIPGIRTTFECALVDHHRRHHLDHSREEGRMALQARSFIH